MKNQKTAKDAAAPKYRAPALEKGLDVLELLASAREPMSLNQISASLTRSVSELFRMIQVLEARGYLEISSSGDGYIITNRLFALGMARAPTMDVVEAALPIMKSLAQTIGQSCHLVVASGDQMVVIARVEAPGDLGFSVRIGYRRALVASTSGLVLYAFQSELVRAEWKMRLAEPVSRREWIEFEKRGHAARTSGFAMSGSDAVHGVIDLSAPIMRFGSVAAALTTPYVKTTKSLAVEETAAEVVKASKKISVELSAESQ